MGARPSMPADQGKVLSSFGKTLLDQQCDKHPGQTARREFDDLHKTAAMQARLTLMFQRALGRTSDG